MSRSNPFTRRESWPSRSPISGGTKDIAMSWLGRLFGRGPSGPAEVATAAAEVDYRGFTIRAEPSRDGGQFQIAGTILKAIDGEERRHTFIRADRFPSLEDATALSLQKGRQIVDEQGDAMFARAAGRPG
jgi:hypothetical protein